MTAAMVSEVDRILEKSNAALERARERTAAPTAARANRTLARAKRFGAYSIGGVFALLIATGIWSAVISPIGIMGVLVVGILALGIVLAAGMVSREAEVKVSQISEGKLVQVADRTDRWLAQQRPGLPAPAQTLADSISARLFAMRGQIDTLESNSAPGQELRRMMGEELPELVSSYLRVPTEMRRTERNGRVAEQDLVQGLKLLDSEIDEMARALAAGDMDRLSSQKRYLEMRYRDDEASA